MLLLAVTEMGYNMQLKDNRFRSGSCVSGQTIKEATAAIQNLSNEQMIIVNIGSTDILNGKELIDIIFDTIRLMKTCAKKSIIPIFTTLPPLKMHDRQENRPDVLEGFNDFLRDNPFNFPIIDISKIFVNRSGDLRRYCFQNGRRYLKGQKKPFIFWSKQGRKNVMACLKKSMGDAILDILF